MENAIIVQDGAMVISHGAGALVAIVAGLFLIGLAISFILRRSDDDVEVVYY